MIHFVSGKGGVGKSLVAASMAKSLSDQGHSTLLVELGGSRFLEYVYEKSLTYEPQPISDHLSLALWEGEECLREYLQYLLKFPRIADLFFDNRIMQALVHGAPGLKELALTGKITSQPRKVGPELNYEHIVIDAYSTGHFKALLSAPLAMAKAIAIGPMGSQSKGIHDVLSSTFCEYFVVVTPEELPITEGMELAHAIQAQVGRPAKFIKNKWWPENKNGNTKSLPQSFLKKWASLLEIQKSFDPSPFHSQLELPQLWLHDNREKIEKLAKYWGDHFQ